MSAAAILNFCIFGKILKVHHWTANGFTLSAPKIIQNQWKTYFILWNQRRTLSFLDCRMLFSKLWNRSPKQYQRAGRNSWTIPIPTWPFPFHCLQPGLLQVLSKGNIRSWLNVPCPLLSAEWLSSYEQRKIRKMITMPWYHSASADSSNSFGKAINLKVFNSFVRQISSLQVSRSHNYELRCKVVISHTAIPRRDNCVYYINVYQEKKIIIYN